MQASFSKHICRTLLLAGVTTFCLLQPLRSQAQPQRVNLAKFQSVTSDSATPGDPALFVTDGVVGNTNNWASSGAGPHWATIQLPLPMPLGSAQVYLGTNDTVPVSNFSLQYFNGGSWVDIPGAAFSGNTATVLNIVFSSAVTASQVRFYSTDAAVTVREIALFGTNAPSGYPIGTDVGLNLGKKCTVVASSVDTTNYAKLAVDGYAGSNTGWWQSANVSGPHTLEVDFLASARVGSAQVYSGSATAAAISDFTLEYWTGSAWTAIPGGTVSGNTQKELGITFSSPVSTARVRLNIPGSGTQIVRELAVFSAASGLTSYPLWTDVVSNDPPTTVAETFGDGFWILISRTNGNALIVSSNGASQLSPTNDVTQQFQVLYNYNSDTFRLRHRSTGLCVAAQNAGVAVGTAVVEEPAYSAMPHELWRFQDMGGGYFRVINVWNGLALQTDGQPNPTVTLAVPSADARQQWQFSFQTIYPKKGSGSSIDQWARFGASWNYNWSRDPGVTLPPQVVFSPMQWSEAGIDQTPQYAWSWQREKKPMTLLAFNEPDLSDQANMLLAQVVALWPQLEAADVPLASPATAWAFSGYLGNFYAQAASRGFRVDYTAVHWYSYPSIDNFISHLQSIYTTWGKPLWLTEFSSSGSGVWSDEDNYRFLAEFLWRAEDLPWLHRYAIFNFAHVPPTNPWDRTSPNISVFETNGVTFTTFGELYAAWDADRTIHGNMPYTLHNKGASFRVSNPGAGTPGVSNIRVRDVTVQWQLVAAPSTNLWYIQSLGDGRRLSWDGTTLSLASSGTVGTAVEWLYTAENKGYYFIDHPATSRRLRMDRTNDGNGAPTSVTLTMAAAGTVSDNTRWRFIKPYVPISSMVAVPGNGQVALNWTAVSGAAGYNIKRSTTSGGLYTLIGSSVSTNYTDTGLSNGITYYYVVSAFSGGGEFANSSETSATPQPIFYAVNSGGSAADWFKADACYSGGTNYLATTTIDTSNVTNPAPQAVYQTDRYGDCTYTFTNLMAGVTNLVRLHFSENYWKAAGKRVFNVSINGTQQLTSFDIFAVTGIKYKAVIREFNVPADGSGSIIVQFTSVTDSAQVNGIEIRQIPPPAPVGLTATGGVGQVVLNWNAASTATGYNVKRATVSGGVYANIGGTTATNYTDTSVTNGTTYYYVISAINLSGEGAYSGEANATPYSALILTSTISGGQIHLSWPDWATNVNLYSATNINPPITWLLVTNAPVDQNGTLNVSVPIGSGDCFFRLAPP